MDGVLSNRRNVGIRYTIHCKGFVVITSIEEKLAADCDLYSLPLLLLCVGIFCHHGCVGLALLGVFSFDSGSSVMF